MKPQRKQLPPPIVRREPPTIEEAVAAAEGLASDLDSQLEIAAGLMGVPEDQVRPYLLRPKSVEAPTLRSGRRVVVVERRPLRAAGASALRR